MEQQSQSEAILAHLQSGKTITPLEALDKFQCLRLGGRIFDLRKQGHVIHSKMVRTESDKFVAEYSLVIPAPCQ